MAVFDDLFSAIGSPMLGQFFADENAVRLLSRGSSRAVGPFKAIVGSVEAREVDLEGTRSIQHSRAVKFPRQNGLPFWEEQSLIGLIDLIGDAQWAFEVTEDLTETFATVRVARREITEAARPGYRHM
jgi:hypothetical protein